MIKSNFVSMEFCEFHEEDTPSMAIYDDNHYYCFGCYKSGPLSDLKYEFVIKPKGTVYAENIPQTLAYINRLPKKEIRGFQLPYDSVYYYLVWPDNSYYTARAFNGEGRGKYRCPVGHPRPLYAHYAVHSPDYVPRVIVVEGEFNAKAVSLMVARGTQGIDVVSPGSAGDLAKYKLPLHYTDYLVIVDNDKAGAIGALKLAENNTHARGRIHLMDEDANDVLVNKGSDVLRNEIKEAFYR